MRVSHSLKVPSGAVSTFDFWQFGHKKFTLFFFHFDVSVWNLVKFSLWKEPKRALARSQWRSKLMYVPKKKKKKKRQIVSDVKTLLWSLEAIRYKTQEYNGSTQVLHRNIRSSASLWLPVSFILLLSAGGGHHQLPEKPGSIITQNLMAFWVSEVHEVNEQTALHRGQHHHTLSTPHFHTTFSPSDSTPQRTLQETLPTVLYALHTVIGDAHLPGIRSQTYFCVWDLHAAAFLGFIAYLLFVNVIYISLLCAVSLTFTVFLSLLLPHHIRCLWHL